MKRNLPGIAVAILMLTCVRVGETRETGFANFESPQAHSITVSENGERLFALNAPGNALAVYSLETPGAPTLQTEVAVGLEPVSMAQRSTNEVWIVNHLSDSISVVDLERGMVVETIAVGDRPGDVVFAGEPRLAFVTSMTERTVRVIDARTREVVETIVIPAHSPRTLLASADGKTVWVASYLSGNRTTVIPHSAAPPPPPPLDPQLPPAPAQGIIVDAEDPDWKDTLGFTVADEDVFEIDVESLAVRRSFKAVGTILFNLAERPGGSEIWVANTEARNLVRFEPTLRGHVVDNRITRLGLAADLGSRNPRSVVDLNPGLDYEHLPDQDALATALAQPTDIVFTRDGGKVFVASFGTDRIGVLDPSGDVMSRIEVGDATGAETDPRNKLGPRALAIHPDGRFLYSLNRLANNISIVDVQAERCVSELSLRDPTPERVRAGRGYLFDAKLSGNGTVSCASCHVDADRDGLAWDLGDPRGNLFHDGSATPLHPMKGPFLTQTLRGLAGERIFHWRADRPGLESFNGTFPNLLGGQPLAGDDLAVFVDYLRSIRFGPNPLRNRDDTLPSGPAGTRAEDGEHVFTTRRDIGREGTNTFRCVDCHVRSGGAGSTGFTGLVGQPAKAAQLRGLNERTAIVDGDLRISGFGYGADGSRATLREFLEDSHRFKGITEREKAALESFLLAFPTETPAIVGFTRTVHSGNRDDSHAWSDLQSMMRQAERGKCAVVVTGRLHGRHVELHYDTDRQAFRTLESETSGKSLEQILSAISGDEALTFVAHPVETAR